MQVLPAYSNSVKLLGYRYRMLYIHMQYLEYVFTIIRHDRHDFLEVWAEAARVRRSASEPSLPTPDPWFAEEDLQEVGYRSHDDLGSRMAGRCPKGHILEGLGSIAAPKGPRAARYKMLCIAIAA